MCVCVYVCICICVYICMYVCMYVDMYICGYVGVNRCTYMNRTEQNISLLRTPKGYKAHQDITFNSVMANIHNDNILHTQICSKAQY